MTDLRRAFRAQGRACARLGSPFMARLMPLLAERLDTETAVGARLLGWKGDVGPAGQSLPLRLAGALHGLVLDKTDRTLATAYPPHKADDEVLWTAIHGALTRHEARINSWLDQAPQTNEVRRAAALLPALWHLDDIYGLAFTLSEMGASAGLNLSLDKFALHAPLGTGSPADSPVQLRPEWRGAVPPAPRQIRVTDARGVDRNPINPHEPASALRLMAFLWPDQPHRLALTRGAITCAGPSPDAGDAAPWISDRLATPRPGACHVVYTTIAWQYFPVQTQATALAAIEAAGAAATARAPLAHLALEADGRRDSAALTLRHWPHAPDPREIARADFHGRFVDWSG